MKPSVSWFRIGYTWMGGVTTIGNFILEWTSNNCEMKGLGKKFSDFSTEKVNCAGCFRLWIFKFTEQTPSVGRSRR